MDFHKGHAHAHVEEIVDFVLNSVHCVQVNVRVDYIKPAQDTFPEKTCCTVTREDV